MWGSERGVWVLNSPLGISITTFVEALACVCVASFFLGWEWGKVVTFQHSTRQSIFSGFSFFFSTLCEIRVDKSPQPPVWVGYFTRDKKGEGG